MKRVLVISPHFPPDTGAASHRMRLLAPRLPEHGWEPVVVAVRPGDLGARIEPDLVDFVHGPVRVERVPAFGGAKGRFLGVGDLGLRALLPLSRRCRALARSEPFDMALITLPPHYGAALGPHLRSRAGLPYVLDYQDPWVGAWGLTVGGGAGGAVDARSRLSRRMGLLLEPRAARGASGLAAVTEGTLRTLLDRVPGARDLPRAEIPLGGDARDFVLARERNGARSPFPAGDGLRHLVFVGTLLPHGLGVLRGLFEGAALLRREEPAAFARLRFHFLGTSNRTVGTPEARALPLARECGVAEAVRETPLRVDYLEALSVLSGAAAVLLLGSTEPHYTASRIYPAVLSGRPLLAIFHRESPACEAVRRLGPPGATQLADFAAGEDPAGLAPALARMLAAVAGGQEGRSPEEAAGVLGEWSAASLAGRMAGLLDAALERSRSRGR